MQTRHRILLADARKTSLEEESVDLIVTSPPYPMIEMWDGVFSTQAADVERALGRGDGPRAFEAMHEVLDAAWDEAARVLRPGGIMCVNVGDATRTIGGDFGLYPNHARILSACFRRGLTPLPAVIWRKQTNAPNKFMGSGMLPGGAYVTLEHEYVLILRKGAKRAFTRGDEKERRRASAIFWEERNQWFSDLWDFKGERQRIGDPGIERRSAAFPFELAYRLISMYSMEGDVVLDPFSGTGTTAAAAVALARNSVGIEIDPDLRRFSLDRIRALGPSVNERSRRRLVDHLKFLEAAAEGGRVPKHVNATYDVPVITSQETSLRLLEAEAVTPTDDGAEVLHRLMPLPPHVEDGMSGPRKGRAAPRTSRP